MSKKTVDESPLVVSIISKIGEFVGLPVLASKKIESLDLEEASKEENFGYVLAIAIAITLPVRTSSAGGVIKTLEIIMGYDLSKKLQTSVCQIKDSMDYQGVVLNAALIQSGFFSDEENELIDKSYTDETLIQVLFNIARKAIHKKT